MQSDPSAYLNDILEAAAAIQDATAAIDEDTYTATRLIRSAVEREFIIIGEALKVISQRSPQLFAAIPEGRQIMDFRAPAHPRVSKNERLCGLGCHPG
jgi:uncharacterized protein with HEPN domain